MFYRITPNTVRATMENLILGNSQISVIILLLGLYLYCLATYKPKIHMMALSILANWILRQAAIHRRFQNSRSEIPCLDFEWPNGQGTQKFFAGRSVSRRWQREMGPLYQIWSGFKPEIVLTEPEHLRSYFRDSNQHQKAANNNSGWLFGELLGSAVGLVSGRRWLRLRPHLEASFSLPMIASKMQRISTQAEIFVQNLPTAVKGFDATSQIDVVEDLKMFPFLVVAEIFFGELSDKQEQELREMVPEREDLFKEAIKGGSNRSILAKYFPTKVRRNLLKYKSRWQAFIIEAYKQCKAHQKHAAIVSLWDQVMSGSLTVEECTQSIDESLFANLDVTASAVSWNHVLLAQHPKVQHELRDEVAKHRSLSQTEWLMYLNRSDTLLAFCVLESSRLRPILSFSNPESATNEKVIGQFVVPRNVDIIVDSYAINVENPFWVNGTEYNPRRFEELTSQQYRYHLWRFGFGPRQCLGKYIADRMVRALTGEVVYHYLLSLVDEPHIGKDFVLRGESWVGLPQVRMNCVLYGAESGYSTID